MSKPVAQTVKDKRDDSEYDYCRECAVIVMQVLNGRIGLELVALPEGEEADEPKSDQIKP